MTDRPLPQTTLKLRREQTIVLLCEHFAQDRLEVEEFESRLDRAHRAATISELEALLQDLPAAPPPPAEPAARDALARGTRAVADAVRGSRTLLAIMGGVERKGRWQPARRNVVIAVMGGAALDFREVVLPPGRTEVFIFCLMGGVEIIVPPSLAVDASGVAIMGGFEHTAAQPADPEAPVLRINGLCLMGGVEILVRHPGESAKDARERQREERRALREQRRRLRDG